MVDKLERKDPRFKKMQIIVDVYCEWIEDDDGHKRGLTRFRAFPTDVSDDDGEIIGRIGGGTGAVTLSETDGDEWTMHHDDLWYAFQEALENV